MPSRARPVARLLLPALLALGLGAGAWWALAGRGGEAVGLQGEGVRAALPDEEGRAGPGLQGVAVPAPEAEVPLTLRLVDAQGRPLAFTYARVTVQQRSVRGPRRLTVRAPSDAEGVVRLDLPGSTVVRVEVELGGAGALRSAGAWAEGIEAAALEGRRLAVEGVAWLNALTVDEEGQPSPRRRVLYREVATAPAPPRVPSAEVSEDDGSLRLGPFDAEAALEVWADARGQVTTSEAPETGWRRVALGEEQVKIPFPPPWPLRLRIVDVAPDAEVQVGLARHPADAGVPTRLVEGVWTQVAGRPRAAGDVFVGPLPDGRFAHLRDVRAEEQPIDVELVPGEPLQGRGVGEDLPSGLEGVVRAATDLWAVEVPLRSDGTFSFAGLPPGGATLWAEAREPVTDRCWVGMVPRAAGPTCQVRMLPALRLRGRIDLGEHVPARPERANLHVMVGTWARGVSVACTGFEVVVPSGEGYLAFDVALRDGNTAYGDRQLALPAREPVEEVVLRVDGVMWIDGR